MKKFLKENKDFICRFVQESNEIEGYSFNISRYEDIYDTMFFKNYINADKIVDLTKKSYDIPYIVQHFKAVKYVLRNALNIVEFDHILKMHKILMKGTDLNPKYQGTIKPAHMNVYIAGRKTPSTEVTYHLLSNFIHSFNNLKNVDNDMALKEHALYEYIHPFADGNGRTGRLWYLWRQLSSDLELVTMLDNFEGDMFREKQYAYYRYLQQTTKQFYEPDSKEEVQSTSIRE